VYKVSQALALTGGRVLQGANPEATIDNLLLDSRKVVFPQRSAFFAIQGANHDGHQFIQDLYDKGVRTFFVEKELPLFQTLEANFIEVPRCIEALQRLAAAHRQQFRYPVVGITGSNGKTIVKEWLSQLLAGYFRIIKSPKSYNSQIGVPLSVWQMNHFHNLGIFEAGISQTGEMEALQQVIQPTLGILTNIGPAHDAGFASRSEKIDEKLKLFKQTDLLIYCKDYEEAHRRIEALQIPTFSWAFHRKADVRVMHLERHGTFTELSFVYLSESHTLEIPFIDDASIENVMHCLCLMLYFKLPFPEIVGLVFNLKKPAMRLELKPGKQGNYLIDDSYNNDLSGLQVALDYMNLQPPGKHKVAILSEMYETGLPDEMLFEQIAALLQQSQIETLIGIGQRFVQYRSLFDQVFAKQANYFFEDVGSLLNAELLDKLSHSLILVKGARRFAFEKIVQRLQEKNHRTVLEINLDALVHNLNFYRSCLHPTTKVMIMVKAFAYGSGITEVAALMQFHKVDYLAVAYADEGVHLRQNGIYLPIMVMNTTQEDFDFLIDYDLEPNIFSLPLLEELTHYLQQRSSKIAIHIELDTGMRRLGFLPEEVTHLTTHLLAHRNRFRVAGLMSHLAAADSDAHEDFSKRQIEQFQTLAAQLEKALGYDVLKHMLNSPGIVRFPEAQMDMVRLGVGLYGVEANKKLQGKLESVGTLKTTISQIKHIRQGESVSYGRNWVASRDSRIAIIAIGYADGFNRKLSNGVGAVQINGQLTPTVGLINMDMSMVDVTDIEAQVGDEVIIFGKNPTLFDIARQTDTIAYEIMTNISERVKRIFYTN